MRALTVRQPWAAAIIWWGKSPENRIRNIAGRYRGPLAIHAGLVEDEAAYDDEMIREALAEHDDSWVLQEQLETGVFLGVVDLVDVHLEDPRCCTSPWAQRVSRYDDNPLHHLVVKNPRPLERHIPARGMLGLWTPPPDVVEQLQAVTA